MTILMIKIKTLFLLLFMILSVTKYTFAEEMKIKFIDTPKAKTNFSGTIPIILNKGFEHINEQIQIDLLQDETRIYLSSEVIYTDLNYLNLHIHQEIEGGISYYREKYYLIDLNKKRLVKLDEVLKKYKISAKDIEFKIAKNLSNCLSNEAVGSSELEYCEDPTLDYLLRYFQEDENFIQLTNADGVYLKEHILGIVYSAGPYSVSFEYNLNIHQIE